MRTSEARSVFLSALLGFLSQGPEAVRLHPGAALQGVVSEDDGPIETDTLRAAAATLVGDSFRVEVDESGPYTIDLRSYFFDTYLVLRDAQGGILDEDDDGLPDWHSRIVTQLAAGEVYEVQACGRSTARGPYVVSLQPGEAPQLTPPERAAAYDAEGRRRVAAVEARFGPESAEVASVLNRQGKALWSRGEYAAARPLFERALAIREKVLDPDHPDTARSLNNLAVLLESLGDHRAALSLQQRALAIREKVYGKDGPGIVVSLGNLASCFVKLGDYAEARPYYERALGICEDRLGPEHPYTSWILSNLGVLLQSQGDADSARPLLERALAISERVHGADDPVTASSLENLANVLWGQEDFAAARPLYERALDVRKRALGPDHPDTARSLHNLGALLWALDDYDAALAAWERALEIRESVLGRGHPFTADSLSNVGAVCRVQGDGRRALELQGRALAIREEALGTGHPETIRSLTNVAILLADLGERERAWQLLAEGARRRRVPVQAMLAALSESESQHLVSELRWQLETLLSVGSTFPDARRRPEMYAELLAWKGSIARAQIASREQLAHDLDGRQRELLGRLQAAQAELSRSLSQPGADDLQAVLEERNSLELELRRSLAASAPEEVSIAQVRAALPRASAIVDFLVHARYRPGSTSDGERTERGVWEGEHVCAWVLRSDGAPLSHVDLGPTDAIEDATRRFLEGSIGRAGALRRGEPVQVSRTELDADPLRELLWDPLAPQLEGVDRVIVSPDSFLGALPFETLTLDDGSFLIEHLAFVYLQDVTSLARLDGKGEVERDSLLAVGGVDFGAGPDERTTGADASTRASRDEWSPLPATAREARVVFDLHAAAFGEAGERTLLQGADAVEERLKRELPRSGVLHLATHGFFQPEGALSDRESLLGVAGSGARRVDASMRLLVDKHPGLLSGLVCAGANRARPVEGDDGYLTAEEVAWLDLSGVGLVVMSACETGLGRAQSGEGLIGLRRAFRTAGSRTVISSLWSVQDETTAELMRAFYENLWTAGLGKGEALRAAQLAMLRRNRNEHGEPLPATWGAFVLSGEWR